MLSKESVFEFQQIYKNNFGIEISFNEAKEKAIQLLEFFKTIFKPILVEQQTYEK